MSECRGRGREGEEEEGYVFMFEIFARNNNGYLKWDNLEAKVLKKEFF